jgi:hypothetical protein
LRLRFDEPVLQLLLQEPENDHRFDFTGGEHVTSKLRLVLAEKHLLYPCKKLFGTGLPNCFLENPRIMIAESAHIQFIDLMLSPGMVFRDMEQENYCFLFGGLSRPTGNDVYLYFLGGNFEVPK